MRYVEAKKDSDIKLGGVRAEIDWKGSSAKEVTFRDAEGNVVKVTGSYGIDVLVQAPPQTVTRHRLSGRIPGITEAVLEYHETEHAANERLRDIEKALRVTHTLKVEKVEITEEEADAHPASTAVLEEIPL